MRLPAVANHLACTAYLLALTPSVTVAAEEASALFDTHGYDAAVRSAMDNWPQPGAGIAIVQSGEIIMLEGYGVLSTKTGEPVDGDSVFGIASVSKGFAAATIAKLVEMGKLDWDDPVVKHLLWFAMPNPADTPRVTLRDLLSMRTGISSAEHTFRRASLDRADHVWRLRFNKQVHPLRSEYLYTTDTYTVIGQIVAETTGLAWEEFAEDHFWNPLDMTRTNADHVEARELTNAASPHISVDQSSKMPVIWAYEDYNAVPAGGINSTPRDLARWLIFQMSDGANLLSQESLDAMRELNTPFRSRYDSNIFQPVTGRGPDGITLGGHALGWQTHDYRGVQVVFHPGGIDGFKAMIGYVPELEFGAVVLLNADDYELAVALFQTAVDFRLGLGDQNKWSDRWRQYEQNREASLAQARLALEGARRPGTTPSLDLFAYQGTYSDLGAFGRSTIKASGDTLVLSSGRMTYDLAHWHHDVFRATPRWPYETERSKFFVYFRVDEYGDVTGFRLSIGDASFNRTRTHSSQGAE
ncbi:MAG: serine hydrolase [Pseudomonadota bacterium]